MGIQRRALEKPRLLPAIVAPPIRGPVQNSHPGGPWTTRLPAGHFRRLPAFHYLAAPENPLANALLPRRRPLGAQAAEQPALVQNRERVGGQLSEEMTLLLRLGKWVIW